MIYAVAASTEDVDYFFYIRNNAPQYVKFFTGIFNQNQSADILKNTRVLSFNTRLSARNKFTLHQLLAWRDSHQSLLSTATRLSCFTTTFQATFCIDQRFVLISDICLFPRHLFPGVGNFVIACVFEVSLYSVR